MSYEAIWKSIIRPPRENYPLSSLGPSRFSIRGRNFRRKDLILENPRGQKLQCSHFLPRKHERVSKVLPCVVYLHCNAGSRLESLSLVKKLLPSNITVFSFDFSGCGLSEGEYITLGWHEKDDLKAVIEYLRLTRKVSFIGLCGRSMGAVTALLYGETDPSIAAIVADSPFYSLRKVIKDQVNKYAKIPGFIISAARKLVKKTILKKTGFDIDLLDIKKHVSECFIPILFCHGVNDNFIKPYHTEKLFLKYGGEKDRLLVDGDHNSVRPKYFFDSVAIYFYNALQCDLLPDPRISHSRKISQKLPKSINLEASFKFQKQLDEEDELILQVSG
jgi:alpha/beta superfamily hydrolase